MGETDRFPSRGWFPIVTLFPAMTTPRGLQVGLSVSETQQCSAVGLENHQPNLPTSGRAWRMTQESGRGGVIWRRPNLKKPSPFDRLYCARGWGMLTGVNIEQNTYLARGNGQRAAGGLAPNNGPDAGPGSGLRTDARITAPEAPRKDAAARRGSPSARPGQPAGRPREGG